MRARGPARPAACVNPGNGATLASYEGSTMFDRIRAFHRPTSVAQALRLFEAERRRGGPGRWVAGGTDLVVQRERTLRWLVDLTRLPLGYVHRVRGGWAIGATTHMSEIEHSKALLALANGILAEAAGTCGSPPDPQHGDDRRQPRERVPGVRSRAAAARARRVRRDRGARRPPHGAALGLLPRREPDRAERRSAGGDPGPGAAQGRQPRGRTRSWGACRATSPW